ncbi:hypothetical protein GCM10026983_35720 [Gracilibacillus alcaliphilus]
MKIKLERDKVKRRGRYKKEFTLEADELSVGILYPSAIVRKTHTSKFYEMLKRFK